MSDLYGAPSLINNKMESSTNTVIEKEVQIEPNDSNESIENPLIKSMDCVSEVIEMTKVKSTEHSEYSNSEISTKVKDSSSQSKTPEETLNEQLNNESNKIGSDIKNDNSMSVDNQVTSINKSELNMECLMNSKENNFSVNNMSTSKRVENSENSSYKQDLYFIDNCNSLHAIAAEYDSSDSENEDKKDSSTKISNSNVYRNIDEVVITDSDSSDSESDSSSSSESERESDNGCHKSSNDDTDEEKPKKNKGNQSTKAFKLKSEFDDLPPIEVLKISVPEVLCDPLGEVAWTVEQMVVVRPKPGKPTLNLDTVLFIEKGQRALGHIFDVFGQVAEPHYCVRFNSSDHIHECDIKVGMTVYYCPNTPYTSLVFLSELTKMKAADDVGDDEPPQFSDDEEEQAYLASLKNTQNNRNIQESSRENPNKRKRANKTGWQLNHPWNSNKDHQQNVQPHSSKPFYRTHHPWSRPRYQQPQNQWHPYNFYPNQWMGQYPPYDQMQAYNQYFTRAQTQPVRMQNQFPEGQWDPRYQLPQANPLPLQGATRFNFPPPPPPPPPPSTST